MFAARHGVGRQAFEEIEEDGVFGEEVEHEAGSGGLRIHYG
jgi:hypothetical protein